MSNTKEAEHKEYTENQKYIKWLSELSAKDVSEVGGKAANLAEMYSMKLPVPPAFVIVADAYNKFLRETGLDKEIYVRLNKIDVEKTSELESEAEKIRDMIKEKDIPEKIKEEILENYEHLSVDEEALKRASEDALSILKKAREPVFVAVRSSATAEDSEAASFAGQQKTFINVKGKTALIEAVKGCWASLFSARSIYYRVKKGFKHEQTSIAVVVQEMVNPEKSGVIFSKDPVELSDNIVIEAVFGLGEGIVSGAIAPDTYKIKRENLELIDKKISDKKTAFVRNSAGKTEKVKLTAEKSRAQVLTNYEIKKLSQYTLEIEAHYNKAQDIEFAIDSGRFYIVQTRPITTLDKRGGGAEKDRAELKGEVILSGLGASPGIASGIVKIVRSINDLSKIKKGDVLVTEMTNPDMVVAMQKSVAIVTDEGGLTSHASIVSREMGIPAVVGTGTATTSLNDGEEITVDGFSGKIYKGKAEAVEVEIKPVVEGTKTKIKVIVDLPSFAERAAKTHAKSIGLTRIEGIIAEGGKHPDYYLKKNLIGDYEKLIYSGVEKIAEHFEEVWVRTSDLRSDEYRNLEGSPKDIEANPMLGMHGIRASLKYPEILKAELNALKKISDKGKKIGILTPQVISVDEIKRLKERLKEIRFSDAKIGVMVETPASVQIIRELCEEKIDFASFGTNDLTQYTLAVDRGNEEVQNIYNEMHPAVLRQLGYVIDVCKEYGVETSICGQAGSKKEMAKFLVEKGIDSISVNADKAFEISQYVKELERDIEEKGDKTREEDDGTGRESEEIEATEKDNEEIEAVEEVEEEIDETGKQKEDEKNQKENKLGSDDEIESSEEIKEDTGKEKGKERINEEDNEGIDGEKKDEPFKINGADKTENKDNPNKADNEYEELDIF